MLNLYEAVKTANNPKRYIDNRYPELVNNVNLCAGITFSQKLYNYIHGHVPTCYCGNNLKWESFRKGYRGTYCSNACRGKNPTTQARWYKSRYEDKTQDELDEIKRKNKATNKLSSKRGQAKGRTTKLKNGTIRTQEQKSLEVLYREQVKLHTESQPLWLLENYKLRDNHATNLNAYHLDHIYSVAQGFKNGILPYIIGSIHNLRMTPWRDNIAKGAKCDITIDHLVTLLSQDSKYAHGQKSSVLRPSL